MLAKQLGISDITVWLGFISQEDAAKEWANMDVAIIPSLQESFGVSAIEAEASGTPLIVSNIPGLNETTVLGKTCLSVDRKSPNEIAKGIISLYSDFEKYMSMSEYAPLYVAEHFELDKCFCEIESKFYCIVEK